ncbi:MAG TPA: hypothetical protein DCL77_15075, partial [Prolixibacteraceae bacterium]|nr:hypothetical protein [Prolixibacteraceae bacterium]
MKSVFQFNFQHKYLAVFVALVVVIVFSSFENKTIKKETSAVQFQPISFTKQYYVIDGKPSYLYSGEFHYFRVPKKDWKKRMELFKAAGGNCLATYVPWIIHEPEEGNFLFGDTDIRDLELFIQTAKEVGLYLIIKPGPYQYSELRNSGVPEWLTAKYPEIRAQNFDGSYNEAISYVHPIFLQKTEKWFDEVCPILAKYTTDKGGPIAVIQLDNECDGMQLWGGGMDYNKESMGFGKPNGRYTLFLKNKYGTIEKLNTSYNSTYKEFTQVEPSNYRSAYNAIDLRKAKDYTDFYFSTIADYFQALKEMIQKAGIHAILDHNAYNTNASSHYLEAVNRLGNEQFLLGIDHYYNLGQNWAPVNNPDPQWAIRIFQSLETLRLLGYPPTVLEFPAGSLSDWPPITPTDVEAAYMMHLGFGLKGSNYYIYTGGPNPLKFGLTSDDYGYNAAITSDGKIAPLYETEKKIGAFVKENTWITNSERVNDCRIAYDLKISRSGEYWKAKSGFLVTDPELYTFSQKGMINTLFCGGYSPSICNLDSDDWMSEISTPLIVLSSSCMSEASQKRVIDFLKKGGKVLLCPVIPEYNENFEPCRLLKEFLGLPEVALNKEKNQRISFNTVKNVMSNNENFVTLHLPVKADIIGRDENSNLPVCWKEETEGKGKVIFLGFNWYHQMKEHIQMMDEVLNGLGIKRILKCSNPNLFTSLRTNGQQTNLFVMNLY